MNILFELNDGGRTAFKTSLREELKSMAIDLRKALNALHAEPTDANMTMVNGMWVRARNLLKLANTPEPDPQGGASREGARLAA